MNQHDELAADEVLPPEQQHDHAAPAVADDVLPDTLVLLPLPGRPFFPGQVQPVSFESRITGRTRWMRLRSRALACLAWPSSWMSPTRARLPLSSFQRPDAWCGCTGRQWPNTDGQFLAQGMRRFRIVRWLNEAARWSRRLNTRGQGDRDSDEVKAYAMAIIAAIKELLPLNPLYSEELKQHIGQFNPNQPSLLADFAAALTTAGGISYRSAGNAVP